MNPEDRTEIKAKILVKIRRARTDVKKLEELTKPIAPENSIGRITRMDAINNKSVNDAALVAARSRLGGLEKALLKIDEPGFGMCAKCGNQIQMDRLKIMPGSTHCMTCAK